MLQEGKEEKSQNWQAQIQMSETETNFLSSEGWKFLKKVSLKNASFFINFFLLTLIWINNFFFHYVGAKSIKLSINCPE